MKLHTKIAGIINIFLFLYVIKYYIYYVDYDNYYSLARLPELKRKLYRHVHGQHIAIENILKHMSMHYKMQYKALALSLHGDSGTGKSYFIEKIIETLYRNKRQSVHYLNHKDFSVKYNYPIHEVKRDLAKRINDSITTDPDSLFIFDRAEKFAPVILESLINFLDYSHADRDENMSKAIFIFVSNSGSEVIRSNLYNDFYLENRNRTTVKINDIVPELKTFLYNDKKEYYYSKYIKEKEDLIEFIPFLPLEREQVLGCLKTFFKLKNIRPKEEHLKEALKHIEWHSNKIYAVRGCKDVRHAAIRVINNFNLTRDEF